MKTVLRVILIIIALNGIFYYGWVNLRLIITHLTSKNALSSLSAKQQSELLRINVADLDKDESDEVWFNDQLFDVVKREKVQDIEYVYVAKDEEEQNVLEDLSDHFRADDFLSPCHVKLISSSKNVRRGMDQSDLFRKPPVFFSFFNGVLLSLLKPSFLVPRVSEVLKPPPKLCTK